MHVNISHVGRGFAFIAIVGCALPASAQDDGWYLGAGIGRANYGNEGTIRYDETTFTAKEETSGEDTSASVWAGYRLNRYFSVELGYVRNDGTELVLRDEINEVAGRFEFRTQGATLTVVGTLPLGKWEPHARAGVFYADTEIRIIDVDGTFAANSERGAELIGALGLAYNLAQHWQAKLEGACLLNAGERTGTAQTTVYVGTVGFTYRF